MNWNTIMTATRNAYGAFKFTLANPGDVEYNQTANDRFSQYRLGWKAYTNDVFASAPGWSAYAESAGLYPKTRPIYNPVTRLVDFYASHIYQGALSMDGANLPDGELLAIPLAKDTPDEIRTALGQLYTWGNLAEKLDLLSVYGASMGDVAIEGVENTAKGRVWPQVVPASHITDYELDDRANVIAYTKEYRYYDRATSQSHAYKKTVTKEWISEYKDGTLTNQTENLYGFAPLVLISHRNLGTLPGAPAVRSWGKIETLNSLASRLDAGIRVKMQSPTAVIGKSLTMSAPKTADGKKANDSEIKMIFIEGDGTAIPLDGNLDIPGTMSFVQSLMTEIEHDHPEITMYNKLREMTQVTGPAAEILMGDVKGYVDRARQSYDGGLSRMLRMLITMAGVRANERAGGWQDLSDAQKKFLPFNLDSYERGDLDFEIISSRPLVKKTKAQYWQDEQLRLQALQTGVNAGEPLEWQEKQAGMSDEDWAQLQAMQHSATLATLGDGFPPRNVDSQPAGATA
jgi:hypothetical protein